MPKTVKLRKVYSEKSHSNRSDRAPIISIGVHKRTKTGSSFEVVTRMTPELRSHPKERKALLAHEKREAEYLAKGNAVSTAHRKAASQDPDWLKHSSYKGVWKRLGKKVT